MYLTFIMIFSNVFEVRLNELQLLRISLDMFLHCKCFNWKLTWVVKNGITGWKDTSREKVTNRLSPWRTWVSLTVLLEVEGWWRGDQEEETKRRRWRGGDEERCFRSVKQREMNDDSGVWAHKNRSISYKTPFIPKHETQICVKKGILLKCVVLTSYFWSHRLSAQTSFCHTSQTHAQQSAALSIQLKVMHLLRLQVWLLQRWTTKSPLVVWARCAAARWHLNTFRENLV